MKTIAVFSVAIPFALVPAVASAQSYSITELTTGSGFDWTGAYGLSQNGKITGAGAMPVSEELHAYIYDHGAFQDLGNLGYSGADGDAINNTGQVAATGYGPGFRALRYTNGHVIRLGSIDGGFSEGVAINNLGHIVGRAQNGDGGWQAFFYNGAFNVLDGFFARGINDTDQIVGTTGYYWQYGKYVYSSAHGYILSGGVYAEVGDLGGGVRTDTEAFAINNAGQITGYSTRADGTIHAFRYAAGVMTDLGTIEPYYSYGVSINSHGDVVGNLETYVGGPVGAFLYTNGALHDLADLLGPAGADWTGLSVNQINDAGWIVGNGTFGGTGTGFLAQPLAPADLNCDGKVDGADIAAFLLALQGPAGYGLAFPMCNRLNADFDADGAITAADIALFVARLLGA